MNVYFLRSAVAGAICLAGAVAFGQAEPKLVDPVPPETAREAVKDVRDDVKPIPGNAVEPRDAAQPGVEKPAEKAVVDNKWRFLFHNGEWWYWTEANAWKIHRNGAWMDYDPATFRRIDVPVYSNNASGGYYANGYSNDGYYSQPYRSRYPNSYYGGVYGPGFYGPGYYGRGYGYGYGGGTSIYFGNGGGISINTGRGYGYGGAYGGRGYGGGGRR